MEEAELNIYLTDLIKSSETHVNIFFCNNITNFLKMKICQIGHA